MGQFSTTWSTWVISWEKGLISRHYAVEGMEWIGVYIW